MRPEMRLLLACFLSAASAAGVSRRQVVGAGGAVLLWPVPALAGGLGDRLQRTDLGPLGASLNPLDDQELYYPEFLFGEWRTEATLVGKTYPFGKDIVPRSLVEGTPRNRAEQVGDTHAYDVRYFSTLANSAENNVRVSLGLGMPRSKIIADRAFNARSVNEKYDQLTKIASVEWDPTKDPTRLTTYFKPMTTDDMRPVGPKRVETYITARQREMDAADAENPVFRCSEKSRSVSLQPGSVVVTDLETITEYRRLADGRVKARQRILYFFSPNPNSREGVLWQQVGGKAAAIFDYDLSLERRTRAAPDGSDRACVDTPKGFTQCW